MTNTPAPDFPPSLQSLLDKLGLEVADFTLELEQQDRTVDSWQRELEAALTRYHLAAYMTGQDSPVFDRQGVATVQGLVTAQLEFLDNFALVIKSGSEWERSWNARAAMYAESIKVSYWRGATKVLPLPAMPAEGLSAVHDAAVCGQLKRSMRSKGILTQRGFVAQAIAV